MSLRDGAFYLRNVLSGTMSLCSVQRRQDLVEKRGASRASFQREGKVMAGTKELANSTGRVDGAIIADPTTPAM